MDYYEHGKVMMSHLLIWIVWFFGALLTVGALGGGYHLLKLVTRLAL
jgi:hypothetical protein